MKITLIIFAFLVCFLANSNSVFGQTVADEEPYVIPSNESGELHSVMTDGLAVETQQSNERLFVVVYRGSQDTNSRVNITRLVGVRTYLSYKKFGSLKPVFSVGERVEGEGRIEYYIGSKLRLIMFAPKNKIPNFTCCENYIPLKKKLKRKKRKR